MPHDMGQVRARISQAMEDYGRRAITKKMGYAELRIAQKLAFAGRAEILVENLQSTFAELCQRVERADALLNRALAAGVWGTKR